jgi:hypothetical protein
VDVALLVAIIGAIITGLGWLVQSALDRRRQHQQVQADRDLNALRLAAEDRLRRDSARLSQVTAQLQELYGPLVCLMYEGREGWDDLLRALGHPYLNIGGRGPDDPEVETWLFWAEHLFLPANERIMELLTTKMHLVEGPEIPDSYVSFIQHHQSWAIRHARWSEAGVPYDWHSPVVWPIDFEVEIHRTFATLKSRQEGLIASVTETETPVS